MICQKASEFEQHLPSLKIWTETLTWLKLHKRLNDHRSVLPNNFLIWGVLPKSCLKVTDLNYVR